MCEQSCVAEMLVLVASVVVLSAAISVSVVFAVVQVVSTPLENVVM